MKLLIMQFCPVSCYILPVRPKYILQHHILKHPQLCSSLIVRQEVSHPHKTTGKVMVLQNLNFMLFDSFWEDKRFWCER
jgi:hypothetical protein